MKNKSLALNSALDCVSLCQDADPPLASTSLMPGMRFFRNGHWWEIDGHIKGKADSYYRCKPACFVESRFYTEFEIQQALEEESKTMNHQPQEYSSRGTGRILIEPAKRLALVSNAPSDWQSASKKKSGLKSSQKEPIKVLLVGSRQAVQKTIQTLHLSGFANPKDWSAFQNRSNRSEVLSILVQKI